MKHFLNSVIFLLLCISASATSGDIRKDNGESDRAYLFSYFTGENDGLHLAYSYDALNWTEIADRIWLTPKVGKDRLMRDPSIVQSPDGTFHMVWTSGWYDGYIGYASTRDFVHWSEQKRIDVMADEPTSLNAWAPEVTYDEDSGTYYIYWASTIPGRHSYVPVSGEEKDWNHRLYYTTTKDFKTFSKTRIFYNPDFSVIDGALIKSRKKKDWILVLKNENSSPAEKNIRVVRSRKISKGITGTASAPITGDYWAEGPAPLYVGDTLYVYFDKYTQGKFGAVRSTDDGNTWSDISDMVRFPKNARHGTAVQVSRDFIRQLMAVQNFGCEVSYDSLSLFMDGKRVIPVMGECHYSRIPADEWDREIEKMKEGGVDILATYLFWNHIEEEQGVYNWSGQRSLRDFLLACKRQGMAVLLRIGPFCHGEARCGGLPDWVVNSGVKIRTEDREFMKMVKDFYRQTFLQVEGLQWKDNGPVLGLQFDNEYGGPVSYLLTLKKMARNIGFDVPLYTRTGWPKLPSPMAKGEMLPFFGDYADGFWQRELTDGPGVYYKAFNFKAYRSSSAIASEQLGSDSGIVTSGDEQYPYFTCELGGGMAVAYHRRPYVYPIDAYSMATVKLGSGSNLLGYYMYHGGTNLDGKNTHLNECQNSPYMNYNDMPVKSYDFQAPLNEMGRANPQYFLLRKLHLFMKDYAEVLAPMEARFPSPQDIAQGEDKALRWSYRTDTLGRSAFIFINNYERFYELSPKTFRPEVCGVKLPEITIPSNTVCILPVNIDGIRYATAQIIAKRNGKIFLEQIDGIPTEIAFDDGTVLKDVKIKGVEQPIYRNCYLIDSETAGKLFLDDDLTEARTVCAEVGFRKVREAAKAQRTISAGAQNVAEEPSDDDFEAAAVYEIQLPSEYLGKDGQKVLNIDYVGDVARLYADGKLVEDNFYYGRPMQVALWRLPEKTDKLELRILPQQKDMPVYLPKEAVRTEGENVIRITVM